MPRNAVVLALAALLGAIGCDEDGPHDPVTVDVEARIAVEGDASDGGVRVTGEVVIDLEAPADEEGTELVLMSLQVGPYALQASDLQGLETFPDQLAAGETARVVLTVDRAPVPGEYVGLPEGCGDTAPAPWDVSVQVLDARAAESSEWATGYVTATTTVELPAKESGPAPLVATTIWGGAAGVMAVDPDGGDVLVVSQDGFMELVRADGAITRSSHIGISPSAVARGGGVDVVAGWLLDALDPRCDTSGESLFVVARIVDGDVAWCRPIADPGSAVLAVDHEGVTTIVEGGATAPLVLRRLDAEGATLGTTPLERPPYRMLAAPDGRVVALSSDAQDLPVVLVIAEGDVRSAPVDSLYVELGLRPDGEVAARADWTWAEIDLDTATPRAVGTFDPWVDILNGTGAELEPGLLVALTSEMFVDPATTYGTATSLELSTHQDGIVQWQGAIACTAYQAVFLPGGGLRRYAMVVSLDGLSFTGQPVELLKIERAP